jgi:hypothetical protein
MPTRFFRKKQLTMVGWLATSWCRRIAACSVPRVCGVSGLPPPKNVTVLMNELVPSIGTARGSYSGTRAPVAGSMCTPNTNAVAPRRSKNVFNALVPWIDTFGGRWIGNVSPLPISPLSSWWLVESAR